MILQRTIQNGPRDATRYVKYLIRKETKCPPLWTKQPISLQLDTTNRKCNLNCIYCNPQSTFTKHGTGDLSLKLINYIIAELKRSKVQISHGYPFMNSDPTLEKRLPTITKTLKKHLHCLVLISTNGALYNRRHLLRDPNINDICFTISASNSKLYAQIHGKPLYTNVLKTIEWLTQNKYWHQRIQLRYILFHQNSHDLANWQQTFKDYMQEVRPLHWGATRTTSKKHKDSTALIETYKQQQIEKFTRLRVPCNCFHNLAISYEGKFMQCSDLPYTYNWGHVEEIDIMETYRKRLDLGLNHKGCRDCSQKNPHWKELFERFTLSPN